MSKKPKNDCSRKEAELELIQSKIAETRSKSFKNYSIALSVILGAVVGLIKAYFGV